MPDLTPPSAALLPPPAHLRERLAIAIREVALLRRLIRAAESARPHPITTADRLSAPPARPRPEGQR
jgi:hypothetical protein